jgi:phosphoglycolate phosphatase-like HAD superfamily hydrolase
MRGLVDLVKEFGCVVEQDILDMRGYKNLYNKALMEQVDSRTERLGQGELDAEDFTMKNSRAFLDFLRRRGVKLYLASGTDQEDLRREAQTLGYGGLFEGRIYGATGDVDQEAKRQVLERILGEIGGDAVRGVAVFGDGPVELREARRVGAIAVGVVSDELRRWGVNPQKRSRLIRAGAHLLIPDFTRMDALRELFHFN